MLRYLHGLSSLSVRPVTLMLPLSDFTVCEGDIAQLEVRFSQEHVEGTWMKNGQAVSPSDRVHIVIDKQVHKLLLENVSTEDAASYSFVVPAQDISTSCKLSVQSNCGGSCCHFLPATVKTRSPLAWFPCSYRHRGATQGLVYG